MEIDTETTLFYGFIGLLILVIATLIGLLIHSGFFSEINVQTCKPCFGEIRIAYKAAKGPYKESGSLFTEAHSLLPQYRTIGVYYDDPKKKEPNRLRYIVGLLLSENGEPINPEHETLLKDWDYKFATFPSINHAVQTSFPFNNTISIIVGIFRVYPILDEYIERRSLCAYPFIEVYDSVKSMIFFVGPLEKQDCFFVPEVLENEDKLQDEEEEEEEEEQSSVSWDESASYIKSDGFDSDSLLDEGQAFSNDPSHTESIVGSVNTVADSAKLPEKVSNSSDNLKNEQESEKAEGPAIMQSNEAEQVNEASPQDEDSDNNTGSSFEEIDEKEAPDIQDDAVAAPAANSADGQEGKTTS